MDSRFQMNIYTDMTYIYRSSSNSFFSEQAVQVCMVRNEFRRTDYVRDAPNVRMNFQCELEKKQIQEEIILAEIVHKRELEAGVKRGILMERELGFPLMAPSSSSSMHYPCDRKAEMPFQRHPDALMPKPKSMDTNLSKTKEADVMATTLSVGGAKKNVQEWSCALCQVSTTCEQGLKDHLRGKKHKKKASQLKPRKMISKQGQKSKGKKRGKKKGKKKRVSHVRVEKN